MQKLQLPRSFAVTLLLANKRMLQCWLLAIGFMNRRTTIFLTTYRILFSVSFGRQVHGAETTDWSQLPLLDDQGEPLTSPFGLDWRQPCNGLLARPFTPRLAGFGGNVLPAKARNDWPHQLKWPTGGRKEFLTRANHPISTYASKYKRGRLQDLFTAVPRATQSRNVTPHRPPLSFHPLSP